MQHAIRLRTRDGHLLEFAGDEERSLLESAQAAQLTLPSSCREGTCGTCRATCVAGNFTQAACSESALPQAERDKGGVLLCRARPLGSLELVVDSPLALLTRGPVPSGECGIESIEDLGGGVRRLRLKAVASAKGAFQASFEPGQYMELNVPGTESWRSYSMANAPNWDGQLEFLIRIKSGGAFSEWLVSQAEPGARIAVRGPQGSLVMNEASLARRVFLGGGTGIAPLLSMLRNMVELGDATPAHLYFGVTTPDEVFGLDQIEELRARLPQLQVTVCVWKDNLTWPGHRGSLVDAFRADAMASPEAKSWEVYVCGPPGAAEALTRVALEVGITDEHVHVERFA